LNVPVAGDRRVVAPHRRWQTPHASIARDEHALVRFERAPLSGRAVGAEADRPDVWSDHGPARIRHASASSRHHEHRAVDQPPAQLGELLLALFFGCGSSAPP
jgi:hypothetical protein